MRRRPIEAILRKKERSSLSLEGHRCTATFDRQQRRGRAVLVHPQKKTNMKDKQWLLKGQFFLTK